MSNCCTCNFPCDYCNRLFEQQLKEQQIYFESPEYKKLIADIDKDFTLLIREINAENK